MIILNAKNLQSLLVEYDQKRSKAISDAESKKIEMYSQIPRFRKDR